MPPLRDGARAAGAVRLESIHSGPGRRVDAGSSSHVLVRGKGMITLLEGQYQGLRQRQPWTWVEDVANVALFLASDESSFISGQVIVVKGGP